MFPLCSILLWLKIGRKYSLLWKIPSQFGVKFCQFDAGKFLIQFMTAKDDEGAFNSSCLLHSHHSWIKPRWWKRGGEDRHLEKGGGLQTMAQEEDLLERMAKEIISNEWRISRGKTSQSKIKEDSKKGQTNGWLQSNWRPGQNYCKKNWPDRVGGGGNSCKVGRTNTSTARIKTPCSSLKIIDLASSEYLI